MLEKQIIQLPKNTLGNDYVIGDVHGSNAGLRVVIAHLKPQDRLFIVGDLFDRGRDSPDVFRLIMEAIEKGTKIYVTRGNHEEMFLKAIAVLTQFANDPAPTLSDELKKCIHTFLGNGGNWIFTDKKNQDDYQNLWDHTSLSQFRCDANFFKMPTHPLLPKIQAYLETLPYIIIVGGFDDPNSFIVCHADLPFTDDELQKRLSPPHKPLQADEIEHLTWKRPDTELFCTSRRNYKSLVTYCGHSVHQMDVRAVREESNHVNLDGGACYYPDLQLFLRLNHTTGEAFLLFGIKKSPLTTEEEARITFLSQSAAEISNHLSRFRRNLHEAELDIERANYIIVLTHTLSKRLKIKPSEVNKLLELDKPLLPEKSLSKADVENNELRAMIAELERLIRRDLDPIWQPGELVTKKESYCCFFSRDSMLKPFYDRVIELGGEPVIQTTVPRREI